MTKHIREPSEASRSGRQNPHSRRTRHLEQSVSERSTDLHGKRGEEKPRGPVYIIIFIAGLVIVGMLVFVMLTLSTSTSKKVLTEQESYTLSSSTVVKGLFAVVSLQYGDTSNASCTLAESYQRPVSLVLRMHAYEVPEGCTIFVENTLVHTENRLAPDCKNACTFQEFDRGIGIGDFDYRDDHTVRVCCDRICIEKELFGLCGEPAPIVVTAPPPIARGTIYAIIGIAVGLVLFIAILITVAKHNNKI